MIQSIHNEVDGRRDRMLEVNPWEVVAMLAAAAVCFLVFRFVVQRLRG